MPLNLAAIATLKERVLDAVEASARERILPKAVEDTPKEEGIAAASGRVVRDGDRVVITFGRDDDGTADHAASNTYIERLHEDMEMRHPHGGQAKFLQRAGDEMGPGTAADVAKRVHL